MQLVEIDKKIQKDKIRSAMLPKQKALLYRLETEIFDEMTCDWIDIMLDQKPRFIIDTMSSNSNGIRLSIPNSVSIYHTTRLCNC